LGFDEFFDGSGSEDSDPDPGLRLTIFESGFGKQNPDPFALIFRSIRGSESRPDLELYAFRVF
jgi:hypothetical protein